MDTDRFDWLTRSLSTMLTRRALAGGLGLGALALPHLSDAKKTRKRKKNKKKAKFNAFGCVNVGGFCKNDDQCCPGIYEGSNDKKTCQAHDVSSCEAGDRESTCGGVDQSCIATDGSGGLCNTTTGNAAYCRTDGQMLRLQQGC